MAIVICWDRKSPSEVKKARQVYHDFVYGLGYIAFTEDKDGAERKLKRFSAKAEFMLLRQKTFVDIGLPR